MRLRGDLHKVDLVIAQMGLENLQLLEPNYVSIMCRQWAPCQVTWCTCRKHEPRISCVF